MSTFDPKLLEAYFRFMAEVSKQTGQFTDTFATLQDASSPEAWANFMQQFYPGKPPVSNEEMQSWLERYWQTLGFVPRSRYDELERQYLQLRDKLEAVEQEAQRLRTLLKVQGDEKTQAAVDAWTDTIKQTLEAQTRWWESWLKADNIEDES
jgi:hypothetical protein